ncbi:hypothetical protein TrVFT333_011387 [Trichoderma virens FT-333]|nr:hypothetical protein TrVFT333_011387 [Trichoderma virens FT-333]
MHGFMGNFMQVTNKFVEPSVQKVFKHQNSIVLVGATKRKSASTNARLQNSEKLFMWLRRVISGLSCSSSATTFPSEAVGSQTHEELPPLVLRSSTEANYSSMANKRSRGKGKGNMKSQGIQIPGLTLLNNLAPHAIAPTSDGSLINPAVPQPPAKAKYVPPRKTKENKKAKARRALAEAQAAANRIAQPPAPIPASDHFGDHFGAYNSNFNNFNFLNPPHNFNDSNFNTPSNRPPIPLPKPPRDDRVAPSKASGGIPDPTPLYIAQSLSLPSALRQPRRILVIMDLNGTLLYRPNKRNPFNFIQRPHAREFLDYCVDTFHQRAKCLVIWGRDKFGLSPADYSARVQCYKRLSSIWNDPKVAVSHPAAAQGQRWDQTNTVLVDDSAEKGRSEPYNILQLPEFEGHANEPLDVLPQVHDYLNTLCYQSNISSYIRDRPFRIDSNYRLPPTPSLHMA